MVSKLPYYSEQMNFLKNVHTYSNAHSSILVVMTKIFERFLNVSLEIKEIVSI